MSNHPGFTTSEPEHDSDIRLIHWTTQQFAMQLASVACLIWYLFVSVKMSIFEVLLAASGMTMLWLPVAWAVYLFTIDQFENRLDRLKFSVISSYAFTTAMYFGLGVASLWLLGIERGFFAILILILSLSGLAVLRNDFGAARQI